METQSLPPPCKLLRCECDVGAFQKASWEPSWGEGRSDGHLASAKGCCRWPRGRQAGGLLYQKRVWQPGALWVGVGPSLPFRLAYLRGLL